jgi:hypothetical protein
MYSLNHSRETSIFIFLSGFFIVYTDNYNIKTVFSKKRNCFVYKRGCTPLPAFIFFNRKENEAKENFALTTAPIFLACLKLKHFIIQCPQTRCAQTCGLVFGTQVKYYGAFAKGCTGISKGCPL